MKYSPAAVLTIMVYLRTLEKDAPEMHQKILLWLVERDENSLDIISDEMCELYNRGSDEEVEKIIKDVIIKVMEIQ